MIDGTASTGPAIGTHDQPIISRRCAVPLDAFSQVGAEHGGGLRREGDRASPVTLAEDAQPGRVTIEVDVAESSTDGF